ncbi:MFS transporter [Actinoplanes sp. NPDC051411]|uniref:MFS transporter n=1 Tax=Actinoplanes sp. NPDC051411 TaxID=3155522 RepID=UPI00342198F1
MTTAVGAEPSVRAANRGVYAAFIVLGFAGSSWAARIPQVRDGLGLSPGRLGLVLLAIAAGSVVSLPLAGQIVAHFGSRRTITAMSVLLMVGLGGAAIGYRYGVAPVWIGLFLFGFANGAWDVSMNVQGALVERRLGKPVMPRFHAGFSVGTVAGALTGAAAVALHAPVTGHLLVCAVLSAGVAIVGVRAFLPNETGVPEPVVPELAHPPRVSRLSQALAPWRESRTLLIGVFVLALAFTEGTGIDWVSVAVIDDYGAPAVVGTLAFAVFLSAMTVGRWYGPGLLDRFGRVPVLRALAVVALLGLLLFVFGPATPFAFAGVLLWGIGGSLGFPVGMSAAADDPAHAAPRVSTVASIGYLAFLGGPPLIGFLGDHVTVQHGLLAVAALLALAVVLAGALRPLPEAG